MGQRKRRICSYATSASVSFLPSRDAFGFKNDFPQEPDVSIARLHLGNAASGLCGGMVYAAADFYYAGVEIPKTILHPNPKSELFEYIVKRLLQSFTPMNDERYITWMRKSDSQLVTQSRVYLEDIRRKLLRGPVPVGLVTVRGSLKNIGSNHQVLAYACEGSTLRVYDPNSGPLNEIYIEVNDVISHNVAIEHPIRGLFTSTYKQHTPPSFVHR